MFRIVTKNLKMFQLNRLYEIKDSKLYSTSVNKVGESLIYESMWPIVKSDLLENVKSWDNSNLAVEKFDKALDYNVLHGKRLRIALCVETLKIMSDEVDEEKVRLAEIFGWCMEVFQGGLLINDDIMDGGLMRRSKPCWHKIPAIGLSSINDASMLLDGTYCILEKYFSNKAYYNKLVKLFNEGKMTLWIGQSLDMITEKKNVLTYTQDLFDTTAKNKTTFYSFYVPIIAALYIAGKDDAEVIAKISGPIFELGKYFTIQDDILDTYGDQSLTGDIASDIKNHKCSWLAVKCVEKASPEQKRILETCYGIDDAAKVAKVKELYDNMNLYQDFKDYEENLFKSFLEPMQSKDKCQELLKYCVTLIKDRKL